METVQLFITCMEKNLLPDVLKKMVLLLERLGVRCEFPAAQTCCGQPFFNSGFQAEGREMALGWMKAFADTEGYIVAPSGSCIEFVKHRYPGMFPEGSAEHERAVRLAGRVWNSASSRQRAEGHGRRSLISPPRGLPLPLPPDTRTGVRNEPLELLRAVRGSN